ncbi:MAG: glycosyltransferase family 4 protein [Pseudomonadota bacterium]
MRIAYFVNQYPKVSHSFIRREIQALEKHDLEIVRIALRSDKDELVDPKDVKEYGNTHFILQQSFLFILLSFFQCLVTRPKSWFSTLMLALKLGARSERGVLYHFLYFVEACVLLKLAHRFDVSHIHVHFGTNSSTVVMLSYRLGGPPYSITIHGPEEFDKPQTISLSEKINHACFVIGISSFTKSQLLRWAPFDQWNKISTVHCGVDHTFLNADVRPAPDLRRLVCVGRLCEQKGQLLLLQALKEMKLEGNDFQLVLAGDGPMRAEIEAYIQENDLSSKVQITGWIDGQRVREEIIKSRALVLPSFAEGLPVVLMEAMALKRPVISTYIAGIPELIIPEQNGFLVSASNMAELKNTLATVLDMDIEQLRNMGEKGRSSILERHDIQKEVFKLYKKFKSVVTSENLNE